jgi:hypothetical protein
MSHDTEALAPYQGDEQTLLSQAQVGQIQRLALQIAQAAREGLFAEVTPRSVLHDITRSTGAIIAITIGRDDLVPQLRGAQSAEVRRWITRVALGGGAQ